MPESSKFVLFFLHDPYTLTLKGIIFFAVLSNKLLDHLDWVLVAFLSSCVSAMHVRKFTLGCLLVFLVIKRLRFNEQINWNVASRGAAIWVIFL